MDDSAFRFFKNALLWIIGILLIILAVTGLFTAFSVSANANDYKATTPQSTVNIYKFEETKEVVSPKYGLDEGSKLNVDTRVNVHVNTNAYYPRSRYRHHDKYHYKQYPRTHYRHYTPHPYGFKSNHHYSRPRYYDYNRHTISWGRY